MGLELDLWGYSIFTIILGFLLLLEISGVAFFILGMGMYVCGHALFPFAWCRQTVERLYLGI
jgi:hypothetical protein